jgi:dsRNA-specific ribonuclease
MVFSFFQNINNANDSKKLQAAANVFEALIAAIFLDSDYSLKTVWDVIGPLFQRYGRKLIE